MIDTAEPPVATATPAEVKRLMAERPALEAFAVIEHRFGVWPLLDAFFAEGIAAAGAEDRPSSLGLFTPSPEFRWCAVAVEGEPSGEGWLLRGKVRVPSPLSGGSLVLARLPEPRLAWIEHGAPGACLRDGWLVLEGALASPLSRPVTLSDLRSRLEAYAGAWALAAAVCASQGVHALRRAARTIAPLGKPFSTSQLVALEITAVKIEAELTAAAVRDATGGSRDTLARALAAARTLAAVAATTAKLRDQAGLEVDGPFAEGSAKALTAFLGGPLMLGTELGRALGIPDCEEAGG